MVVDLVALCYQTSKKCTYTNCRLKGLVSIVGTVLSIQRTKNLLVPSGPDVTISNRALQSVCELRSLGRTYFTE